MRSRGFAVAPATLTFVGTLRSLSMVAWGRTPGLPDIFRHHSRRSLGSVPDATFRQVRSYPDDEATSDRLAVV
jgi:hypothetical protein